MNDRSAFLYWFNNHYLVKLTKKMDPGAQTDCAEGQNTVSGGTTAMATQNEGLSRPFAYTAILVGPGEVFSNQGRCYCEALNGLVDELEQHIEANPPDYCIADDAVESEDCDWDGDWDDDTDYADDDDEPVPVPTQLSGQVTLVLPNGRTVKMTGFPPGGGIIGRARFQA